MVAFHFCFFAEFIFHRFEMIFMKADSTNLQSQLRALRFMPNVFWWIYFCFLAHIIRQHFCMQPGCLHLLEYFSCHEQRAILPSTRRLWDLLSRAICTLGLKLLFDLGSFNQPIFCVVWCLGPLSLFTLGVYYCILAPTLSPSLYFSIFLTFEEAFLVAKI
jgi:hypothetical protein